MNPETTSESTKFTRDIIWVGLSQIFTFMVGFIIMLALTKSYTSDYYGIWSQVQATVMLCVPILTLHFSTAVVRYLAGEDDGDKRRRSLGTMLNAILIFACVMFTTSNLLAPQISTFLFNNPIYITLVRLISLWVFANALYTFFISYLRSRGKIMLLSINIIAISLFKIALVVALVLSGLGLEWIITCMICLEFIFVLYVLSIIIREDGFPVLSFGRLKEFLAFSVPQIPPGIMTWITNLSDRYIITNLLNLSQTGIYTSSALLASVIAMFYAPIGFVLYPTVTRSWEQARREDTKVYFEYSTKLFLTIAIPAAVGLSMISQPALKIFTTSEYLAGMELVLFVSLGQIFMGIYSINVYIVYLVKQTRWLPLMILISASVSIGLNFILIPYMGITGAGISKVVAYFVLAVIVTIWVKRVIDYNINFKHIVKVIAASLVMASCLYFLQVNSIWELILAILIGIIAFGIALFLLKAFTEQDKRLIKQTIHGVAPRLHKKE